MVLSAWWGWNNPRKNCSITTWIMETSRASKAFATLELDLRCVRRTLIFLLLWVWVVRFRFFYLNALHDLFVVFAVDWQEREDPTDSFMHAIWSPQCCESSDRNGCECECLSRWYAVDFFSLCYFICYDYFIMGWILDFSDKTTFCCSNIEFWEICIQVFKVWFTCKKGTTFADCSKLVMKFSLIMNTDTKWLKDFELY